MLEKPMTSTVTGIVQTFLALSFVIWLLFFPSTGEDFAWPIRPAFTAMFIGASFLVRVFIGYHLWHTRYWPLLRWQMAGNFAFLIVVFLATYWHIDEMNWRSSIFLAHIWVVAYTVEPIMLFLTQPRSAAARAPLPADETRGPILSGLKGVAAAGALSSVTIAGLLFINPEFMNTRWPWALDPFDARIMAAFLALTATWCAQIYLSEEWAEVRLTVLGLVLFSAAHFITWLVILPALDQSRHNIYTYGVLFGLAAISLAYYYVRHERAYAGAKRSRMTGDSRETKLPAV